MKLLQGRKIADEILAGIKLRIKKQKLKPCLAVILVGENRASKLYVELKTRAAKKIGMALALHRFKSGAKEKDIIKLIESLNKDKKINGILVQLPLLNKYHAQKIISVISPQKDADGFSAEGGSLPAGGHGASGGHPSKNFTKILPVFPAAIMKLLENTRVNLKNKKGMVISNSDIFGKIMIKAMEKRKIKAIYLLSKNLKRNIDKIKSFDILITAVGKPRIINGKMIKKGAIIIDGGIAKRGKKVSGDVDFSSVAGIAGYLSPVPGGVGPVTVACLLENVYQLSLAQKRNK